MLNATHFFKTLTINNLNILHGNNTQKLTID